MNKKKAGREDAPLGINEPNWLTGLRRSVSEARVGELVSGDRYIVSGDWYMG